jgi:predicted RNA polymerase sigma factor
MTEDAAMRQKRAISANWGEFKLPLGASWMPVLQQIFLANLRRSPESRCTAIDCFEKTAPSDVGPYQLQAAIAAVHDEAASAAETDWPQILALYELLKRMSDNPMVALNHAIAAAMVHGAAKGLELLDALRADARVASHRRMEAVRAHLLELAGERDSAAKCYRAAAGKTGSLPERNYLMAQAARLSSDNA